VTPCPAYNAPANPFSPAGRSGATCWSKINGDGTPPGTRSDVDLNGHAGFSVSWQFPMLIAAIDPQAEARLDGLNHALTSGRYLPENFGNANPGPDSARWGARSRCWPRRTAASARTP